MVLFFFPPIVSFPHPSIHPSNLLSFFFLFSKCFIAQCLLLCWRSSRARMGFKRSALAGHRASLLATKCQTPLSVLFFSPLPPTFSPLSRRDPTSGRTSSRLLWTRAQGLSSRSCLPCLISCKLSLSTPTRTRSTFHPTRLA